MIAKIRTLLTWLGGVAIAPFVSVGRGVRTGGGWAWALHFLLLAAALVGMWRLNVYLELDKLVRAPSAVLRQLWLPLLLLIAYAIAWAVLGVWRALRSPETASMYPEIDRCWRQATAAMRRHGVCLDEKPVLLLLGAPAGREAELLSSFAVTPTFGPVPSQSDAKVRVFADEHAAYVLCHDASLLSTAAERLEHLRASRTRRATPFAAAAAEHTMPAALRATAAVGAESAPAGGAACDGTSDEDDLLLPTLDELLEDHRREAPDRAPLYGDQQADRCAAELAHLASLVRAERLPHAPFAAIAALVPIDSADTPEAADAVGWALEQDLQVLGESAGVRCPVLTVLTELQHAPGCGRLLHVLPADRKSRRLSVDTSPTSLDLAAAIAGLTGEMAPALCQRLMEVDGDAADELATLRDNASLFELQAYLADHGRRLADLLAGALRSDSEEPWRMHGCCLVANGDSLGGGQAFGAGVLASALGSRVAPVWTAAALKRDAWQHRAANAGYVALAAACVGVGALLLV